VIKTQYQIAAGITGSLYLINLTVGTAMVFSC
jgi:hypothetical protein